MDIFSHGLWAGAAAKAANKKMASKDYPWKPSKGSPWKIPQAGKLKFWYAVAWGIFPDLFAFAPAFIGLFLLVLTGQMSFSEWPGRRGLGEPTAGNDTAAFELAGHLYSFSHSLIIFAIVFVVVWLIRKKPLLEMGGWLLHIIMDIPTHTYAFFPTPVFWPLFGWKWSGFQWATPWFLILDYGLLILVYWLLREKKKTTQV